MSDRFTVDTVQNAPLDERLVFTGDGRRTGHGSVVWLWAPEYAMPPAPPVPQWPAPPVPQWPAEADPPPVVAMLDTEVHAHSWLDDPYQSTPFYLDAAAHGWPGPARPAPDPTDMDFGAWWGHGTFIAGLIRQHAPGAQVLPLPVMDQHSHVDEDLVVATLRWLADFRTREQRRLVVLMAFGGEAHTTDVARDQTLGGMRAALEVLAGLEVPVVASAGNDGAAQPRWPAAFATEPELSGWVVSVGARAASPNERAPFSNHGVWVREWREATNVVSLMPLAPERGPAVDSNNFAWWSGTSFAAARFAGELACRLMPRECREDRVAAA